MLSSLLQVTFETLEGDWVAFECDIVEQLSTPSTMQLKLTDQGAFQFLSPQAFMGEQAVVRLADQQQGDQCFSGYVTGVHVKGLEEGCEPYYALTIESSLALLREQVDTRIFGAAQPMTVIDIIKSVLLGYPFIAVSWQLNRSYPELPYCVQYQESDFDFLSRLTQQWGLCYTFRYEDQGQATLIFSDSTRYFDRYQHTLTFDSAAGQFHHLHHWESYIGDSPRGVKTRIYRPELDQIISLSSQVDKTGLPDFLAINPPVMEIDGEVPAHISDQAITDYLNQRLHGLRLEAQTLNAQGNYKGLYPGMLVPLDHTVDEGSSQTLLSIHHHIRDHSAFSHAGQQDLPESHYSNQLYLYPSDKPFSPYCPSALKAFADRSRLNDQACFEANRAALMPDKRVGYVETGHVTGPENTFVHTDEQGRVHVQLHRDEHGPNNQYSSLPVPVRQLALGEGFGSQFIPRVGQEVLIMYEYGDPERPVVVGTVPNALHALPYEVEDNAYVSGFRGQSDAKGGTATSNQLTFDDQKVQPSLRFCAQKNMLIQSQGDYLRKIQGQSQTTVNRGDFTWQVDGTLTIQSEEQIQFQCAGHALTVTSSGVGFQGGNLSILKQPAGVTLASLQRAAQINTVTGLAGKLAPPSESTSTSQTPPEPHPHTDKIYVSPRWRKVIPLKNQTSFATLLRLQDKPRQALLDIWPAIVDEYLTELNPQDYLTSYKNALTHYQQQLAHQSVTWDDSLDTLYQQMQDDILAYGNLHISHGAFQAKVQQQTPPELSTLLPQTLLQAWQAFAVAHAQQTLKQRNAGTSDSAAHADESEDQVVTQALDTLNLSCSPQAVKGLKEVFTPLTTPQDNEAQNEETGSNGQYVAQQDKLQRILTYLPTWVELNLQLDQAAPLRPGWVYVFAQNPSDPRYAKRALYKEYRLTSTELLEVDLSTQAGLDERQADKACPQLELPYQFDQNGQKTPYTVWVFFSGTQLSWPRLQVYGGVSESDPRLTHLQAYYPAQYNTVETIKAQAKVDEAAFSQRAGQPVPQSDLDAVHAYLTQNIPPTNLEHSQQHALKAWLSTRLAWSLPEPARFKPTLLLDDPLGLIYEANLSVCALQAQINQVMKAVLAHTSGYSALMAYNCFFNLRGAGVTAAANPGGIFGYSFGKSDQFSRQQDLYSAIIKAQNDLNPSKILAALKNRARATLKEIITVFQQAGADLLLLDTPEAIKQKAHALWQGRSTVDYASGKLKAYQGNSAPASSLQQLTTAPGYNSVNQCIADLFAQKGAAYYRAFAELTGLWSFTCQDPNHIDKAMSASVLPSDGVRALHTQDQYHWWQWLSPWGQVYQEIKSLYHQLTIKGYLSTHFYQQGYTLYCRFRVFDAEQNCWQSPRPPICLAKLALPPGFAFLLAVNDPSHPLASIVWPSNEKPTVSHELLYLQGQGAYNPFFLKETREQIQAQFAEQQQARHQEESEQLGKVGKTLLDNVLDQAGEFLDAIANRADTLLKSHITPAESIKRRLADFVCDLYGVERDTIKIATSAEAGYSPIAYKALDEAQARMTAQMNINQEQAEQLQDSVFVLLPEEAHEPNPSKTGPSSWRLTDDYEDVIAQYRAQKGKQADKVLHLLNKYGQKGHKLLHIKDCVHGVHLPIHFALNLLAIGELQEAFETAEEHPSFLTVAQATISLAQGLQATYNTCKAMAEVKGLAYAQELNQAGINHGLLSKVNVLGNEKIGAVLGGAAALLSGYQSLRDMINGAGANDPAMAASDFFSLAADSATLVQAGKSFARAASQKGVAEFSAVASGFRKGTEKTTINFIEKAGMRLFGTDVLVLGGEALGLLLPGLDILDAIAMACQVVSFICALFKDNAYQVWAKQSQFSWSLTSKQLEAGIKQGRIKSHSTFELQAIPGSSATGTTQYYSSDGQPVAYNPEQRFFESPEEEYTQLLDLFVSPRAALQVIQTGIAQVDGMGLQFPTAYRVLAPRVNVPGVHHHLPTLESLVWNSMVWPDKIGNQQYVLVYGEKQPAPFNNRPVRMGLNLVPCGLSQDIDLYKSIGVLLQAYDRDHYQSSAVSHDIWSEVEDTRVMVERGVLVKDNDNVSIPLSLLARAQFHFTLPTGKAVSLPSEAPKNLDDDTQAFLSHLPTSQPYALTGPKDIQYYGDFNVLYDGKLADSHAFALAPTTLYRMTYYNQGFLTLGEFKGMSKVTVGEQ